MPQVSLQTLITALRSGTHLASFPTDTVPALAARPDRAALIFAAKQRSADKPLILMASQLSDLWDYLGGSPAERQLWQQVAATYWPGALTLVLPASDRVPIVMNPQQTGTLGVRVPKGAIAQEILCQTGPVATTSANRSGEPALLTLPEIGAAFPEVLIPDPTDPVVAQHWIEGQASTTPSTIVRWQDQRWQVLRQGSVKFGCG